MTLVEDVCHCQGWRMHVQHGAHVAWNFQGVGGGTKAGALSYTRPYPHTELRENRTQPGALDGRAEALGGGAEAPGCRTLALGGRTPALGGMTLALGGRSFAMGCRTKTNAMGGSGAVAVIDR